jgi:hypothetical protein
MTTPTTAGWPQAYPPPAYAPGTAVVTVPA